MPRTPEEAVAAALAQKANVPDTCQLTVRTWLDAPSAGDRDRDGDADAYDGWLSEPTTARHYDRNPPAGYPVAWSGGSSAHGHRALSLGGGKIRSTDAGGRGVVATVPLSWVEQNWGLHYLGWSETIDGLTIPKPAPPKPVKPKPIPTLRRIKAIRRLARLAKDNGHSTYAARLNAWADRIERRSK